MDLMKFKKYIRINESFDIINRTATGPRAKLFKLYI